MVTEKQLLKNEVALYPNAIVVTLEMDKDKVQHSPSRETEMMVFDTYHSLNILTSKLANYLQSYGFAAQPGSSVGGLAHYPWLGEMAGLGHRGKHGLLITPELGPRQRVAVIFTSISNLPMKNTSEHQWIEDFCDKCD